MYEYHDQYKSARERNDVDAQARWARQLTWEIARHAVGEEIVVYPLLEKHLGAKGKQLADHDREEHMKVKKELHDLESLKPGTPEFHSLIERIMADLHHHNDDEEINDLPMLEPVLGDTGSKQAAQSFKTTKKFVPTRSHPSAPNQPPLETLAGFLAAPLDKLKDMFSKFPTAEEKAGAEKELEFRDHDAKAGRDANRSI
ncbi:hypothetical protein BXZ70DRAFT_888910 [Cristinia sonorae]|uniref:Hemerythrin-like domain-containing protein n=1 Tax=Cristinia sonorae TaxID=1940300 RepID=A0A8K0UU83_9AGAR|nr:hypothetical protein BXZ70DRAFT_888910 [Cristinia sonorae]